MSTLVRIPWFAVLLALLGVGSMSTIVALLSQSTVFSMTPAIRKVVPIRRPLPEGDAVYDLLLFVAHPDRDCSYEWQCDNGEIDTTAAARWQLLLKNPDSDFTVTVRIRKGEQVYDTARHYVPGSTSVVSGLMIEITKPPPASQGGPHEQDIIEGRVIGIPPDRIEDYKVVVYSKSNYWYIQPALEPADGSVPIDIGADGSWEEMIYLGNEYGALLVTSEFKPGNSPIGFFPPKDPHIVRTCRAKGRLEE